MPAGLFRFLLISCSFLSLSLAVSAQRPPVNNAPLSPLAPTDRPVHFEGAARVQALDALIAKPVKQARKTLPGVKKRFRAGLPTGQVLFLTTRLFDDDGAFEQVFVRVREWLGNNVSGIIANELNTVKTYTQGQSISFPETAVLDWTISRPDGTEEGNAVGKLLDTLPNNAP